MATLIVKKEDKVLKTVVMKPGQSLTLGRKDENGLVLDDLTVSGSHAKLDYMDEGFLLTDLRSKNGVFVNGQRVTSHWLQHGDVVGVGIHTLHLSVEEGEGFSIDENDMDKTMVMRSGAQPQAPAPSAAGKPEAVLSYLDGGSGEVPLTKKLTKLGKDFSNDVVIGGMMMGKTAATISSRPDGFFLSYIGGWSKPKVNGETVSESVELRDFDIIELGGAKLEFVIKNK